MPSTIQLPLVSADDPQAHLTLLSDETVIKRSVLPGGVRVLSQHVPAQRSVSLSVWVPVGSRDETDAQAGSTHFLEHLLFKGTAQRSAAQIANAFDAVGGESNAGTAKEHTYYWARVLEEDLPMATDVLLDMVTSSILDPTEFERERGVIIDELAMSNDDPVEVIHEAFSKQLFGAHPLARPIGGDVNSVSAITREDVWYYYQRHYCPQTLVVAAAGAVEHEQLCDLVQAGLERTDWGFPRDSLPSAGRSAGTPPVVYAPEGSRQVLRRPGEQAHVILGCPAISSGDDRRYTMSVLLAILGGSMSSRLFQEIRERRGLAYSTYAFDRSYTDAGGFGMYAGCAPRNVEQVEELMREQLADLAAGGTSAAELQRVKGQMRGALALGLEDSAARMSRLGIAEVIHHRFTPLAHTLDRIEAITVAEVTQLAQYLAAQPQFTTVVLPA